MEQIRKRRISSEELTKLCLERIRKHDPKLNAFLTLTADSALEQARASDHDLQKGVIHGPLHGVPIALKDNIDTLWCAYHGRQQGVCRPGSE